MTMNNTLFNVEPQSMPGKSTSIHPVLVSSESNEWYTPARYIEAAREVMGSIDVDPASDEFAQTVVKAGVFYTKETNGFNKRWPGNVWMNPPYGRGDFHKANQAMWTARLIEQYQADIVKQAIILVNSKTGDQWFQPLYDYHMCLPDHRIDFYNTKGISTASPISSAFFYLGPHAETFMDVFERFGAVGKLRRRRRDTLWNTESEIA